MTYYCKECLPIKKQAKYGGKGEAPTCCAMHGKARGFIDVAHTRCKHVGCIKRPNYGIKGGKGTHCREHRSDEMIDVVSKRCEYVGCIVRPSFGFPGGKGTHCGKHKSTEMIDVKNTRCDHVGCIVHPVFGFPGGKGTHCRTHKLPEMVDVINKRCEYVGCIVVNPVFGFVLRKGTHCNDHKLLRMVDVMNQRCTACKTTCAREKDKLCSACRQVQQNGASRKLLRIERRIIDMLILHGTIIDDERTKFNKSIGAACGGYRPDIYIDCGSFILVIEIDENQHRPRYISRIVDGVVTPMVVGSYSTECENKRMMSIVSKEQMPVYFIRINPDKCTIDDKDIKVSFEKRCEALRTLIKSVMEGGTPNAWMTVTYMYYDGAILRTETPDLPAGF